MIAITIIDYDIDEGWVTFTDSRNPERYYVLDHPDMEGNILKHMDQVTEFSYNYPYQSEESRSPEFDDITEDEIIEFILRHEKRWQIEQE